jgi:hypothetical protein
VARTRGWSWPEPGSRATPAARLTRVPGVGQEQRLLTLVQGQETAGQLTVVGHLGCLHPPAGQGPARTPDTTGRRGRRSPAPPCQLIRGPCDGALGDGGQPVAIWVRLDQLAAGGDEPLAGADDPGSASRRSPRTGTSRLLV